MATTDFTPTQARQWVRQEFAKHKTRDSINARILTEQTMLAMIKDMERNPRFVPLPNSAWAHEELLRQLSSVPTS